ncbi:MAG TPA: DUF6691 family protein, partial [Ktedonobacterales bacterium]|nr:DUF6691 family protein [Ktedonobacterales bacterium]
GALFGATLVAARLNDYNVIHRALTFRDPYMFLLMGAAIGVALPGLWLLERAHPRTALGGPLVVQRERIRRNHLLGATIFGIGWALAGTCPGPMLAMTAAGNMLGAVPMLGLWTGSALRDRVASVLRASGSARRSGPADERNLRDADHGSCPDLSAPSASAQPGSV